MKKIVLTLLTGLFLVTLHAQNVGIGTNTPDNTAILDLYSDSTGFLAPRLTKIQRDGITAPAHGLIIFNVTDSTLEYWNGQCWLRSYQEDCNACYFDVNMSALADTIDRVISDSVLITANIVQTSGTPTSVGFGVLTPLPPGVTVSFSNNPITPPGSTDIVFHATPFAPAGTYNIIIQFFCGSSFQNIVFNLTIEPCYILNVINSTLNYNMSTDLYNTYPNAPTNQPICVVAIVGTGVEISSTSTAQPAFTTGNLPAGSLVGILNNGNILGKGGNGGTAFNPATGSTGAGFNGGNAINLTLPATIDNNFNIYGGGGGGNAMAFALTQQIPVVNINFGIFVGSGGGGGAGGPFGGPGGLGGTSGPVVGISYYTPGQNGTAGQFGVGGLGGILNFPIPIQLGPVTIGLNPNTAGGNGGAYGFPGTQGVFQLTLSASANINIPFIGTITVTLLNGINIPIPVPPPAAGLGGFAIKRNGNNCNIPDNNYTTSNLKGQVGN
ncbi:MAG: hypothetical protein MH137_05475 [Flavobacteriales bacterium]|nr:hypothetical protein [Flavobacteriales bacterium]